MTPSKVDQTATDSDRTSDELQHGGSPQTSRPMGLLHLGRGVVQVAGPAVVKQIGLSVVIGISIGLVEIAFSLSLYSFLAAFGMINPAAQGMDARLSIPWISPTMAVIGLAFVILVLRFSALLLPSIANETFNTRIRRAVSRQTLADVRESSTLAVNEVSHILGNLSPKSAAFINAIAQFVVASFTLAAVLVGLLNLSHELTAIAVGAAVVLGSPIVFLRRSYQKYSEAVYSNTEHFTRRIIRDLKNVYFLRISGVNEREKGDLDGIASKILKNHVRYILLFSANSSLPAFLSVVIVVTVVWSNIHLGFVSPGGLVPFVYLLSRTAASVAQLVGASGQFHYNWPFYREMLGLSDHLFPPASDDGADTRPTGAFSTDQIRVDGLVVGRQEILIDGLSFLARSGETLVISGESGKGKTTLLMTLIGVIRKLGGSVEWGGRAIEQIDPARLRKSVGYAGADPFLLDGSIDENLLFGNSRAGLCDADIEAVLRCACAEFVHGFPEGRKHLLREGGEGISAGQKQRLAIARALLRSPSILLLDEATANIDEATERNIMERIRDRFPDLLIIAVSHRASMQQFASAHIEI